MGTSKIEWTESTWNPVTGCTKVSAGCAHCYAERMARRLRAMGQPNYRNGFKLTCHEHVLEQPLNWKTPRTIFVNSMSDLFHEDVPDAFIASVFSVMERASWHQFQVLTKRDERLIELAPRLPWPANLWMGVSVENARAKHRIMSLQAVAAAVRFLSIEPLLESLGSINLSRNSLGHRRRRIGPGGQAHEGGMGAGNQDAVRNRRRAVLLQTVGRRQREEGDVCWMGKPGKECR